ncbi:NADH:flavin oxidoreductase/NADH oxidase family protein [Carpediemonas membranifera]|uniref:NADH:flavin oxidoreductase/NADH oxidase family protein n=1 Tax=Carpediemonas membranifera TaxID=201153 RepID=A0A8J6AWX9_9EUKA|nr:NADH:flavin oxidoreductase/NADH oxidase family protein [Carpediemonas membranifera]|eukprot:KAG9394550.1 NADH:flavin oxidoreductase/NADH oxidase family protein [Carpediemonas membranifera]
MSGSVWEPLTLNKLSINNRWMRSATWEGFAAPNGDITPKLVEFYKDLANGGLGLIISSHTYIRPDGALAFGMSGIVDDEQAKTHIPLVEAVHAVDGAKIVCQINHTGALTSTETPICCSKLDDQPELQAIIGIKPNAHELTTKEMEDLEDVYVRAAVRCKNIAGYDGVQFHGAHQYFIAQTLSELTNQRTDVYGQDRSLFFTNVVRKTREAVGPDFFLMAKINGSDFLEIDGKARGTTIESTLEYLKPVADLLDAVEVSGGGAIKGSAAPGRKGNLFPVANQGYHTEQAKTIKERFGEKMKVILVGGIRTPKAANKFIDSGVCDAVSMSRPLIVQPDLIKRLKADPEADRVACVSCSKCHTKIVEMGGLACANDAVLKKLGRE